MIGEEVLPYIEIAGHMGLAVGIQVQTRGEQHHVGVGAKDGPRRSGTGDAPAHRGVKALHPLGLEQVLLYGAIDACHGVIEAGEPTVVFGHQLVEEIGSAIR